MCTHQATSKAIEQELRKRLEAHVLETAAEAAADSARATGGASGSDEATRPPVSSLGMDWMSSQPLRDLMAEDNSVLQTRNKLGVKMKRVDQIRKAIADFKRRTASLHV